jgi:hypothetical protein
MRWKGGDRGREGDRKKGMVVRKEMRGRGWWEEGDGRKGMAGRKEMRGRG